MLADFKLYDWLEFLDPDPTRDVRVMLSERKDQLEHVSRALGNFAQDFNGLDEQRAILDARDKKQKDRYAKLLAFEKKQKEEEDNAKRATIRKHGRTSASGSAGYGALANEGVIRNRTGRPTHLRHYVHKHAHARNCAVHMCG